jgi:hypothetical protein
MPLKTKLPEPFAVVEAFAAPLKVTVAPGVPALPEIVKVVGSAVAVKEIAETFAPLTVTVIAIGLNAYPVLLGVSV